jgi:sodium/hydrogen antiporter
VVHGVAATPVMQLLDREGERTADPSEREAQPVAAAGHP